jgi:hypothetical protein
MFKLVQISKRNQTEHLSKAKELIIESEFLLVCQVASG